VLEADFYGTGKVPWNGAIVLKHSWQLEEPAQNDFAERVQATRA
jgi:hypothetical protein